MNEEELEQFLKPKKQVEYLDVNGYITQKEPNVCCGKRIHNEDTDKKRWFVKLANGVLFHPLLSDAEKSRATYYELECTEDIFNKYQKFLNKRNEADYNRVARLI